MKTPKEIKEFLNNKVLANISGNTPKVETISIDDFLEWFENRVLIPNKFYYCECTNEEGNYYSFVFQKNNNLKEKTEAYHILNLTTDWYDKGESSVCDDKDIINLRLATPAQKQLLIDKVQKETDKIWNEDTKKK